jgi:hypothetical protein
MELFALGPDAPRIASVRVSVGVDPANAAGVMNLLVSVPVFTSADVAAVAVVLATNLGLQAVS